MSDILRQLQLTQLDILVEIDRICRKYNIRYSLYAGTLLGAVRHKGFIPWDDDLDICMPRKDYERFLDLWKKENVDGYILQNKESNPEYMNSFSKIRKDHTTFLEHEADIGRFHTGIFVDVFPVDRLPKGRIARIKFLIQCMLYQLFTREYASRSDGKIIWLGCMVLLKLVPRRKRKKLRQVLLERITSLDNDASLDTVFIETFKAIKRPFSNELLDEFTEVTFENGYYMAFSTYEDYLKNEFGDYMQLPPEEERTWVHHPLVIDFEKNIDELDKTIWKPQS